MGNFYLPSNTHKVYASAAPTRGRINLPKKVRKALGVHEGDDLVLEIKGKAVMLIPKRFVQVSDIKGTLHVRVNLEEIEEAAGHL